MFDETVSVRASATAMNTNMGYNELKDLQMEIIQCRSTLPLFNNNNCTVTY